MIELFETTVDPSIAIRVATFEDAALIFSFIQKKADFDRGLGAFAGVLLAFKGQDSQNTVRSGPFFLCFVC